MDKQCINKVRGRFSKPENVPASLFQESPFLNDKHFIAIIYLPPILNILMKIQGAKKESKRVKE